METQIVTARHLLGEWEAIRPKMDSMLAEFHTSKATRDRRDILTSRQRAGYILWQYNGDAGLALDDGLRACWVVEHGSVARAHWRRVCLLLLLASENPNKLLEEIQGREDGEKPKPA